MPSTRRRSRACRAIAVALLAAAVPATGTAGGTTVHAATMPGIAVDELTPTPADGVFHLQGHGFGGGVGLSQWGAQGGAEQGATASAILARYYPTTTVTTSPASTVRVLLSGQPAGAAPFLNAADLTVTGGDGATIAPPGDAAHSRLRLLPSGNGLQLQSSPDGSTWTPEAPVAAPATVGDAADRISVGLADGSTRPYRGRLTVTAGARVVDVVGIEDYLRGVVPRESPPSWLPAALQAQAVAARSYAANLAARAAPGAGYDICDTAACQAYGGAGVETPSTDAAVAATADQELTSGGAPVSAQYGASDGGFSVDGGQPYLPAAPDPWDGVDAANTGHSWTAAVTAAQLQARYPAVGRLTGIEVTRRDGNGEWGGRVLSVTLRGVDAAGAPTSVVTTGADVVNAHAWPASSDGLRSSWWQVAGQNPTAAAVPSTLGIAAVTPFRVVETFKLGMSARRVVVAGRHGVPSGATAVFVVASAGRLSKAQRADLLIWPSLGNRAGAVAIARLTALAPTSGSGLVPLGRDGGFDVAGSNGVAGLELTVVGWVSTTAVDGISPAAGTPVAMHAVLGRGAHRITGLRPPPGAGAAILSVTASAARTGSLRVAGAPVQTLTAAPQSTTVVAPLGATLDLGQAAAVRVQVLGYLTPSGTRLAAARPLGRPVSVLGRHGGVLRVSGGPVPSATPLVLALLTEISATAGDLSSTAHGALASQLLAAPAGRASTALIAVPLRDGRLTVKPPAAGTKVQLVILGWA